MLSFRGATLSSCTSFPAPLSTAISNDAAQNGRSLIDAPNSSPNWKTVPQKLQAYEALYWFNRSIEATLESLDGLERLGLLRGEDLNEQIRIEHARAQAK
jgi:hypothetical protein